MRYEIAEEEQEGIEPYVVVKQKPKGRGHVYEVAMSNMLEYPTQIPSVTTVLRSVDGSAVDPISRWSVKQALKSAMNTCHNDVGFDYDEAKKAPMVELKKAGDRGTSLHEAMEMRFDKNSSSPSYDVNITKYLLGKGFSEKDISKARDCFNRLASWIDKQGYQVVGMEMPVFDGKLMVGGTIDMLLSDNKNTIFVADLKTGKNVYTKDAMQVGAYINSIVHMMGTLNVEMWQPFPESMPMGDRINSLNVGGAVIHMNLDKPWIKINHIDSSVMNNIGFMAARNLHKFNQTFKFQEVASL